MKYRERPTDPPEYHAEQFLTIDKLPNGVRPFYPTPSMVKKECGRCGKSLKAHGELVMGDTSRIMCPEEWVIRIGNKHSEVLSNEDFAKRFDVDNPLPEDDVPPDKSFARD